MIKLENVKVMPLFNPNFTLNNKNCLIDMISSTPIIYGFDYYDKNKYENKDCKIIGMVSPNSSIGIEDNFLTSDIYIMSDYLDGIDYTKLKFKNYEASVDEIEPSCEDKKMIANITKIHAIEFEEVLD